MPRVPPSCPAPRPPGDRCRHRPELTWPGAPARRARTALVTARPSARARTSLETRRDEGTPGPLKQRGGRPAGVAGVCTRSTAPASAGVCYGGAVLLPAAPMNRHPSARQRGRPVGTLGPIACALPDAARQGPAVVRTLAMRARVSFKAARCTASRLVARGAMVASRKGRPALLSLPTDSGQAAGRDGTAAALALLQSWPRDTAPGGSRPEPPSA
jgi:hypothetical protein